LGGLFFGDLSAPGTPAEYHNNSFAVVTSSPTDATVSPADLVLVNPGPSYDSSYDDSLSFPMSSQLLSQPYQQYHEQSLYDEYLVPHHNVDSVQHEIRNGIETVEAEFWNDSFFSEQASGTRPYRM